MSMTVDAGTFTGSQALPALLSPTTVDDFLSHSWECEPLVVSRASPGYFSSLFSSSELDRLIGYSLVQHPQIRVVHRDKGEATDLSSRIPANRGGALQRINGIYRLYGEGCTIIINDIHRLSPALGALCIALEATLNHRVTAGTYATPRGSQGFGEHFDIMDAVILQIEGSKSWKLWSPEHELPLEESKANRFAHHVASTQAQINVELEAGDLLYVPRGWIHSASTTSHPSLHITVGIHLVRWKDVVQQVLLDVSEDNLRFRRAMPPGWLGTDADLSSLRSSLSEVMETLLKKAVFDQARENIRRRLLRESDVSIFERLAEIDRADNITFETSLERAVDRLSQVSLENNTCALEFMGGQVRGPAKLFDALTWISSRSEPFTCRQMPGISYEAEVLTLIRRLVRIGFLRQTEIS